MHNDNLLCRNVVWHGKVQWTSIRLKHTFCRRSEIPRMTIVRRTRHKKASYHPKSQQLQHRPETSFFCISFACHYSQHQYIIFSRVYNLESTLTMLLQTLRTPSLFTRLARTNTSTLKSLRAFSTSISLHQKLRIGYIPGKHFEVNSAISSPHYQSISPFSFSSIPLFTYTARYEWIADILQNTS